jgi:hypothetical protein
VAGIAGIAGDGRILNSEWRAAKDGPAERGTAGVGAGGQERPGLPNRRGLYFLREIEHPPFSPFSRHAQVEGFFLFCLAQKVL